MKTCSSCKETLPLDKFYFYRGYYRGSCKACNVIKTREWRSNNREHYNEWCRTNRKSDRELKFGMTDNEYENMLDAQAFMCLICGTDDEDTHNGLHADHDHKTGKVRGLLCPNCNKALGLFKDNPAFLRAAADYLERFGA